MHGDHPIRRYLLTVAILPVGAWIVALTISLVLVRDDPAHALIFYPTADALARTAELELKDTSVDAYTRERIENEARRSLIRSSANPRAAAVLATVSISSQHIKSAERLLNYSEQMSRRHLPTQLFLLQFAVEAGNIDRALQHYDRAMRVSLESRMLLFPILVQASDNPVILPKVVRFMNADNSWKSSFLDRIIAANVHPATIAALVGAAGLDPNDSIGGPQLAAALAKLVSMKDYAEADQVFRKTCTPLTCAGTPINGGFEHKDALPPFGWELLADQTELLLLSPGHHVLVFSGWSGGPGARQLMRLAEGRYIVRGTFNIPMPASAITLTVTCADSGSPLATLEASHSGRQGAASFLVPAACGYQWLTLSQASRLDRDADPAWIDDIAIARVEETPRIRPTDVDTLP